MLTPYSAIHIHLFNIISIADQKDIERNFLNETSLMECDFLLDFALCSYQPKHILLCFSFSIYCILCRSLWNILVCFQGCIFIFSSASESLECLCTFKPFKQLPVKACCFCHVTVSELNNLKLGTCPDFSREGIFWSCDQASLSPIKLHCNSLAR